jgi:hypothetical protein
MMTSPRFDVSQEPFVGLYNHVIFLAGARSHSSRAHEIAVLNVTVGGYKIEMGVDDLIRMG